MRTAYIGMGANLESRAGAPAETLRAAADMLSNLGSIPARSSLYSTAPVGYADQPRFTNAVVALDTALSPLALLQQLMQIERHFGRDRAASFLNGPRTLDLDILLIGDLCIATADLTVPHPRLTERAFVLVPLHQIAPQLRIPPTNAFVADLLDRLSRSAPADVQAILPIESSHWSASNPQTGKIEP
jgi:2-amino-4-hydroxy-6-hydroxymethyldihydropteridine diphosphokinase